MKSTFLKVAALVAALLLLCGAIVSCTRPGASSDVPSHSGDPASIPGDETVFTIDDTEYAVKKTGNVFEIDVPNGTEILELKKMVTVAQGVSWTLATDISIQSVIPNKTVALGEGVNVFYVYCSNKDETISETYELRFNRSGSYKVSFEGIEEVQSVADGGKAVQPSETPQKEGYSFAGWNFDFSAPVTASQTVAAKWEPNTYVIVYEPNLGTMASRTQTVVYGQEVSLTVPEREGYVFADWFIEEQNERVKSGVWTIASNVTLTAHWANDVYTVTYNVNGGKMTNPSVVQVSYGAQIVFPTPVKDGAVFGGWYDGDTLCVDGVFEYTKGLNLVAHWIERSSTLTFVENGGTQRSYTETLAFGAELPVPERSGYTFGGWFTDVELTRQALSVPETSMRLYAWWQEEDKPGVFLYELSGLNYKVTARKNMDEPAVVPEYIGGLKTIDAIPLADPNAGVTLETDFIEVKLGRSAQIIAVFTPKYPGDDTVLTYSSSKPDVVLVDEYGVITTVGNGGCTVTVSNEATGLSAQCVVIVNENGKNANAGLSFSAVAQTVVQGSSAALLLTYVPEYASDSLTLTFTSSDESIVSVDENGVANALAEGECVVMAADEYGRVAVISLTVVPESPTPTPTPDPDPTPDPVPTVDPVVPGE